MHAGFACHLILCSLPYKRTCRQHREDPARRIQHADSTVRVHGKVDRLLSRNFALREFLPWCRSRPHLRSAWIRALSGSRARFERRKHVRLPSSWHSILKLGPYFCWPFICFLPFFFRLCRGGGGRQAGRKEGRKESGEEGRKEGRKKGRKEGSKAGRQGGRKEGRRDGRRRKNEGRLYIV